MIVAYIAHPIGGDVKGNLAKIAEIGRKINLEEQTVIPFAPYYFDCHCLDDDIPEERERGIRNDSELLRKGFVDEIRLYGDRISKGMAQEVELAIYLGIRIRPMTPETKKELKKRIEL